jgi:transcriptional regulator GlxA family with amidase domain
MISQLDLMMALIERFCGTALAHEARRRLAAPQRISQAPYIAAGSLANGDRELAAFESFVSERLKRAIVLEDAARALHMSTRTLARRTHAATGLSPSRLIQKIRLGCALNLIEHTRLPLDRVAESVGLADAGVLHRLVVRHTGQSPGASAEVVKQGDQSRGFKNNWHKAADATREISFFFYLLPRLLLRTTRPRLGVKRVGET